MVPIRYRDLAFEEFEGANERAVMADQIALESVMLRSERKDTLLRKVLIRALGLFAYIPELTYEKEDVDYKVVEKMLRHPELLNAVGDWIFEPSQELVPKLQEAARVFTPLQKRLGYTKIYRGFNPKSIEQDTMGLQRKGWFGPKPADFKVGDKFSYVTERALSFTYHEGTASVFGGVVVSIDPRRYSGHLLSIDLELSQAIALAVDSDFDQSKLPYFVTYGELVLLPSKRPVEFKVESKRRS